MIDRLRRMLATRESLRENRWLRWLGPALHHPRLWHMSRKGIAVGTALGVFFGLLVPIAQIPLSAAAAVALRANVPAAMASTLVTNPLTFAPVYYAAWRTGSALLGEPAGGAPPRGVAQAASADTGERLAWWQRAWHGLTQVGRPLMLGLAIFACSFGLAAWGLVNLVWHLRVRLKRRRRLRAGAARR